MQLARSQSRKTVVMSLRNTLSRACLFAAVWTALSLAVARGFEVPLGERQLFLDDDDVAGSANLTRTMHRPEKKGAVIRGDYIHFPSCLIQTRCCPIWDPEKKVYKTWVLNLAANGGVGLTVNDNCTAYYESKDGLNWYAPEIGQVEYNGSKQNNLLRVNFNNRSYRTDCVVYDPSDPDPSRRYKMTEPDIWRQGRGIFAVSPNGIDWTVTKSPGVPSEDEWNLSFDEKRHLFIHYVKHPGPITYDREKVRASSSRSVYVSTSKDFEKWTEPKLVFWADEEDQKRALERIADRIADSSRKPPELNVPDTYRVEVYHMSIFRYESQYIGIPAMCYHTGSVPKDWSGFDELHLSPEMKATVNAHGDYTWFYELQLASSRDLEHWTRQGNREPWMECSRLDSGAYDLNTIISPAGAVVRDDELWFYYTGLKNYAFIATGKTPGYDDYSKDGSAICLAVLRRDGFVSLDAGKTEGSVVTKPFKLTGEKLYANVFGRKDGELRIQMLDDRGEVIAESTPITGDQPRAEVQWKKGEIADHKGQDVSLRFNLRNASLYSFWMTN